MASGRFARESMGEELRLVLAEGFLKMDPWCTHAFEFVFRI